MYLLLENYTKNNTVTYKYQALIIMLYFPLSADYEARMKFFQNIQTHA